MVKGSIMNADGFELAYFDRPGSEPALLFLPGFNSVMTGEKAEFLDELCAKSGSRCVRFDYRGHGVSSGELERGGMEQWFADAACIYDSLGLNDVVLGGSSMGGWVAFLLALSIGRRVRGIVAIGAAVDFTRYVAEELSEKQKTELEQDGITFRPSRYGDGPYPLTARMLLEGENNLVLGKGHELPCPLQLFHGMVDPDLPWGRALEIAQGIDAERIEITLIVDGDHRLSRPEDLNAIGGAVTRMLGVQ